MSETSRCTKCKQVKLRTAFTADKRRASGMHSWCKVCRAAVQAEKRARHRTVKSSAAHNEFMAYAGPFIAELATRPEYTDLRLNEPRAASRRCGADGEGCKHNDLCWRRYHAGAWVMCCDPTASDVCRLQRQLPARGIA